MIHCWALDSRTASHGRKRSVNVREAPNTVHDYLELWN